MLFFKNRKKLKKQELDFKENLLNKEDINLFNENNEEVYENSKESINDNDILEENNALLFGNKNLKKTSENIEVNKTKEDSEIIKSDKINIKNLKKFDYNNNNGEKIFIPSSKNIKDININDLKERLYSKKNYIIKNKMDSDKIWNLTKKNRSNNLKTSKFKTKKNKNNNSDFQDFSYKDSFNAYLDKIEKKSKNNDIN